MPYLSIVIPAYNEQERIAGSLRQMVAYLQKQDYTWEIIVADDGSTDSTAAIVEKFAPEATLLSLEHSGKGWAVRHGLLAAIGEYRFICDADLSMSINQLPLFLPPIADADIVIGSRERADSQRIGEPRQRYITGRVFNRLIQWTLLPGIRDTQCGFKMLTGTAAEMLAPQLTLDGFAFDVELLYLARRARLAIEEVGIHWIHKSHSKVRPIRDAILMANDILRIKLAHH